MQNKKYKILLFSLTFFIIFFPFYFHENSDNFEAKIVNESTIGYYQSTTCKISLYEVLLTNIGNSKTFYINNNDYVGIECFGKVTGLDLVNDVFIISIGTNTSLSFIFQSSIWIILLFLLLKKRSSVLKISLWPVIISPFFLTFQIYSEERFYQDFNKYHKLEFGLTNYYIISYYLGFLLLCLVIRELFMIREVNIFKILPFLFLFFGTYLGMNLNFWIIIFCFFGIETIVQKNYFKYFSITYFIFSIIWLFNHNGIESFFDADKLRGFINSSDSLGSMVYWLVVIYLIALSFLQFLKLHNFNDDGIIVFLKNSLTSGGLILLFGQLGSMNTYINFFNQYLFGQNKRGSEDSLSVAGNAWRGFAPSAEFIGEFYAFTILLFVLFVMKWKKNDVSLSKFYYLLLFINLFGLYRSNNFAAIISLIIFSILIILTKYQKIFQKKYIIAAIFAIFLLVLFMLNVGDYKAYNNTLLNEAILHSDLFQYSDNYINYLNKNKYFMENDYKTLMIVENNYKRASTSLLWLIDLYTPRFNIPLLPNLVAFLGIISLAVNRTEMWGIFIAKYNPDFLNAAFGYGPFQLNNYLFGHRVRLDLPEYKIRTLFLPHSSLLDLFIFIGFVGVFLLFSFAIYKFFKKELNNAIYLIMFFYYLINLLKSDSILYIPTFTLFFVLFIKAFVYKNEKN